MEPKPKFFALAKKVANKSTHHLDAYKLGCVVVKKGQVISLGWNKMSTHPKSPHPYKYLHAEINAILNTDVEGAYLYVFREIRKRGLDYNNENTEIEKINAIAKPCVYCEMALREAGIKGVFFTTEDGFGFQSYI
jgi:tRNA(Arg) A34 adenosine deaminase TadA